MDEEGRLWIEFYLSKEERIVSVVMFLDQWNGERLQGVNVVQGRSKPRHKADLKFSFPVGSK